MRTTTVIKDPNSGVEFGFNLSDEMIVDIMQDVILAFIENDDDDKPDAFLRSCLLLSVSNNRPYHHPALMQNATVMAKMGQRVLKLSTDVLYDKMVKGDLIQYVFTEYMKAHPEFFEQIQLQNNTIQFDSNNGGKIDISGVSDVERYRLMEPWMMEMRDARVIDSEVSQKIDELIEFRPIDKTNRDVMFQYASAFVLIHRFQYSVEKCLSLIEAKTAMEELFGMWAVESITEAQSELMGEAPTSSFH